MDLSPSQVLGATFHSVRKGYDPEEVDAFLGQVAKALEEAQQQATAMEARARAAVARLQEVSAQPAAAPAPKPEPAPPPPPPEPREEMAVPRDEAETITRTLLLAQRTADTTVAEARQEAERIRTEARQEAESTIDSTREMSARLLDEARTEARRATESERQAAENEVQSLVARREFLIGDVDQLEQFLVDQRERLRAAARQIESLCDRVPAGLGEVRPPVLSAADDEPGDQTAEMFRPAVFGGDDGDAGDDEDVELAPTVEIDRPDVTEGSNGVDGDHDDERGHEVGAEASVGEGWRQD